ncbi:MAG: MFS transporter [Anaerolineae bacterium]|nr:MFS transporter [Anaerolineae bacterium]
MAAIRVATRRNPFEALANTHFRWFWLGRLASSATMEMGMVAQGWLAYELTGSALALGLVTAGRSVARLVFSLYGGALADRIEKRDLLVWTRAAMLVNPLILAFLILSGWLQVWHLVAYSVLSGIISSVMMPAQSAYLSQLVDRKTLMNAVSLTSVGQGLMGIFGAMLAGYTIELLGVETVYFVIAGLYTGALLAIIQLPATGVESDRSRSLWEDLSGGVAYLKVSPIMGLLLLIALARVLFGWSYRSLMPVYVEEVLGLDARMLGILSAAPGVGSLASSLVLASLGDFQGKARLLIASSLVMGVCLVIFVNTSSFALVLVSLGVIGVARNVGMVANQTLIQLTSDDAYRGRMTSLYMTILGLMPLGTIPAGAIADAMGVPFTLTVYGIALVVVMVWLGLRTRGRPLT